MKYSHNTVKKLENGTCRIRTMYTGTLAPTALSDRTLYNDGDFTIHTLRYSNQWTDMVIKHLKCG